MQVSTQTHLFRKHLWAAPVEEVVMEVSVANTELEFLKHGLVLRDVQGIEHISSKLQNTNMASWYYCRSTSVDYTSPPHSW